MRRLLRPTASLVLAVATVALFSVASTGVGQEPTSDAGPPAGAKDDRFRKAIAVPVTGEINDWNLTTFKRRAEDAIAAGADLLVVPLDTPGGELGAAFKFGDYVFNDLRPRVHVAFHVTRMALSAGALIALSGNQIYMGPGGTIGDCQPILMGAGGITEGPEKIQSPIRAVFRKYAEANGYPLALAESMVSPGIEVLAIEADGAPIQYVRRKDFDDWSDERKAGIARKRVVVAEGELLTMTAGEATRYGFAAAVVQDDAELGMHLGFDRFEPTEIAPTWSETLVRDIQAYSMLWILLGLLCLYLEFKTPGFGFFGISGIAAFSVYFFIGYLSGLSEYWEIAIAGVGVLLIGLEIFVVPGFGIPGALGIGCVLVGLFAGAIPGDLGNVVPTTPWETETFEAALWKFALAVLGATGIAIAIARFLPNIPLLNRLVLTVPEADVATRTVQPQRGVTLAPGAAGVALTALRPAGAATLDGTRFDVVTRGEFVEAETPIEVVRVEGNRIVVREATS